MTDPWLLAAVALVGVPLAEILYLVAAEGVLRLLPPRWAGALRPWVWLLPALGLVGVFLVYPALHTVLLSLFGPQAETFVGLANYARAFTGPQMREAFRNNLLWLVVFTGATVSLGLVMAVLADRVRYEPVVRAILFLPMAISFVAAAVIWKFVYEFRPLELPQIGLLNALLTAVVPGFRPVAWLAHAPWVNNLALILVAVWVWTGFALVVLSAALKGLPAELLEAARVDGATEWQVFWRVIVPLLAPTITVVATTMVIYALKAFDVVYVMTSGNFGTEVIANRMYEELFIARDFGLASAIAVILFLAIVPVMVANVRRFRAQEALR